MATSQTSLQAKFHYDICFEPASVMEFGFNLHGSLAVLYY